MSEECESKKKNIKEIQDKFKLDENVMDVESRLEYSKIKSTARFEDVEAFRSSIGLPKRVDFDMDDECKVHCLMSNVKIN